MRVTSKVASLHLYLIQSALVIFLVLGRLFDSIPVLNRSVRAARSAATEVSTAALEGGLPARRCRVRSEGRHRGSHLEQLGAGSPVERIGSNAVALPRRSVAQIAPHDNAHTDEATPAREQNDLQRCHVDVVPKGHE